MKITIDNLDDFAPYLGKDDGADKGYAFAKKYMQFYGKKDVATKNIDDFLEVANGIVKAAEKPAKTESKPPKTEKKDTKQPKADKPAKTEKNDTKQPKADKVKKEVFGDKPNWYVVLESYVKSFAGNSKKQTWRVRAFVRSINDYFNKKFGQTTPHIDLIRKIRKELYDAANNVTDANVSIPKNKDLVADCKAAITKYSINKKERKKIEEIALSGYGLKKKW